MLIRVHYASAHSPLPTAVQTCQWRSIGMGSLAPVVLAVARNAAIINSEVGGLVTLLWTDG